MQNGSSATIGPDHVGLTLRDLEQSRHIFCDSVGRQVVDENRAYPAVFVSDGHDRITLRQVNSPGTAIGFERNRNVTIHYLTSSVPDLAMLDTLFYRLATLPGIEVEFPWNPLGKGPKMHSMPGESDDIRSGIVPNIRNSTHNGLGNRSADDIIAYLKTDHNRIAATSGLMAEHAAFWLAPER